MQSPQHIRLIASRRPPGPHRRLRRRLKEAVVLVAIVNAVGTVAMWLLEDEAPRSEIHNLWDAFFFSTVQLLTVSSQMPNPVTNGGRIVDIVLQLTAICLVAGIAGTFASFFLELESSDRDD
jgi:Ion channel